MDANSTSKKQLDAISFSRIISRDSPVTINTLEQNTATIKLLELIQLRRQLEVLATFVPNEILSYGIDTKQRDFVGVLLFADVSGFTPLTEKYNKTGKGGIYRLTATLNAYIGAIIEVIHFFGGDILKFSGDALLCLWKVKQGESACEVLHEVVECALVIQKNLGIFETEVNVMLKVKLAISCGNMSFSVIGSRGSKYYILVGSAIYDVKDAEHASVSGDVVIAPTAWTHMMHDRYMATITTNGNVKIKETFYQKNEEAKELYFKELTAKAVKLIAKHLNHRNCIHVKKTFEWNHTMSKLNEIFINSLPIRKQIKLTPKRWVIDELRPFVIKPVQDQIDENQPVEYLTEMREITVQFINIVPIVTDPTVVIEMCHNAYNIVYHFVSESLGVVNKVSLFDKDFMILVLYGLRGVRHEMESQHALRTGFNIRKLILESVSNIRTCSIGITQGLVYCGVVGHPFRREFSVIGTEVNKAARIMCAYPSKITCDYKTFRHSKLASFYFQLQSAIKLKGIEDSGNIFEYNEDFEDSVENADQKMTFIGRVKEFNMIRSVIMKDDNSYFCDFNGLLFYGPSKIGKTAILLQSIQALRRETELSIISLELHMKSAVPYHTISLLYDKIYDQLGRIKRDMQSIPDLPRHIPIPGRGELVFPKEDVALCKYQILNTFRTLVEFNYEVGTLIFLDNIEYIDPQSLEIIEIVLNEGLIKLFATASFEDMPRHIMDIIGLNESIMTITVDPLKSRYIASLACIILNAVGIPHHLEYFLDRCCEGKPGYIESFILRLVNNGSVQLQLINRSEKDINRYIFPNEVDDNSTDIIAIVTFSEKYKSMGQELTLQAISMDLFDSFTPYQQLIIKTASVLGVTFNRSLLTVIMQNPPEEQLATVIKQLYEEEVFECGSKFVNGLELDAVSKFCCSCYFDQDALEAMDLPKYAYCKIIHFKNKSIRDAAYDLLPGNQKKELHLLCTEIIEYGQHMCPVCTRQPITYIMQMTSYKTIMEYCYDPKRKFTDSKIPNEEHDDLKSVVRHTMFGTRAITKPGDITRRPHYDMTRCSCFDIWVRVLQDLRYHAEQGKHSGKLVYFTMQYGFVLLSVRDYTNAIRFLREAVELCLIYSNSSGMDTVTKRFKVFILGRTEIGLTQAHLALGQVQIAKKHLTIALRQYNVPSLALEYGICSELIRKSFLVNIKRIYIKPHSNNIFQFDFGNALAYCAKLFALEGKWNLAKNAAMHSLYCLKSVNPNCALLLEVYCNIVDIYSYGDTSGTLEKIQKYVFHEIAYQFHSPDVHTLNALLSLIETLLESYYKSGQIVKGIRLGYRLLDLYIKMDFFVFDCRLFFHLPILLIIEGRIRDAGDVLAIYKRRMYNAPKTVIVYYYISSFFLYLATGFIVEDLDKVILFAKDLKSGEEKSKKIYEILFVLVHIHFLRLGKFSRAEDWQYDIIWNSQVVKLSLHMVVMIFAIEAHILIYLNNYHKKNDLETKRIHKLLSVFKESCKHRFTIFMPMYYYIKAWLHRIMSQKKQSQKYLNLMCKCGQSALMQCLLLGANNAWDGGYHIKYDKRPYVSYHDADIYTLKELSQFIHIYPLE